jgi:hypothetical protein
MFCHCKDLVRAALFIRRFSLCPARDAEEWLVRGCAYGMTSHWTWAGLILRPLIDHCLERVY